MKVMKMKHVYVLTMVVVLVGTVAADSATNTCSQTCGGKEIPHPFGINDTSSDSDCFLGSGRLIKLHCIKSKIYAGHLEVLNINTSKSEIDVLSYFSEYCGDESTTDTLTSEKTTATFTSGLYTISSKENKFITVGRNSYGYFNSYRRNHTEYSTGCLTRTFDDKINDGKCSGVGCCQIDIPPGTWNISVQAFNFNLSSEFCSYSFVVKNGSYTFSSAHLKKGLPFKELPVVLDWTIGGFDENCSTASNGVNNGCKKNSYCDDEDADFGYQCHCNPGFEGNPYHPNGCTGQFSYLNFGNLFIFIFS
jgi:hypothetical protein